MMCRERGWLPVLMGDTNEPGQDATTSILTLCRNFGGLMACHVAQPEAGWTRWDRQHGVGAVLDVIVVPRKWVKETSRRTPPATLAVDQQYKVYGFSDHCLVRCSLTFDHAFGCKALHARSAPTGSGRWSYDLKAVSKTDLEALHKALAEDVRWASLSEKMDAWHGATSVTS